MTVPSNTLDFLNELRSLYKDQAEVDPQYVGTPEYWKRMGVIELLRKVDASISHLSLKQVKA